MAVAFGVATAVFGLLAIPAVQVQLPAMAGWWSAAALAGIFGLPLAMAFTAPWSQVRTIRRWAAGTAVAQLLVLITWVPFMQAPMLPAAATQPWVFGVTALGSTSAGIAWSGRWLWLYLPATGFLVLMDRVFTSQQPIAIPLGDALYAVMLSAVFAPLVSVSLLRAAELDEAAAAAREEVAQEAARRAEHRQRSRVNALLHDQVLVTLLVAGQPSSRLRRLAAAQAQKTLTEIERFESDEHRIDQWGAREFAWQLQAVATESDPGAVFSYEIDDEATSIPVDVAQALAEGLSEALRNILRHARIPGKELHRAVHMGVTASGARVDILDDGRGFDPTAVAPTRLGIVVSIRQRMASVSGGASQIVSVPGQGTRVVLEWMAP